ncbi:GATA zinc finger domain-containing protein 14-like [Armigeres subalbatus]|uniref:GATA zinc finger domain-containing protein 14-like n=1 Tax=Armigeres subalbatus TaxID=124917 RepID=UPI002ED3F937
MTSPKALRPSIPQTTTAGSLRFSESSTQLIRNVFIENHHLQNNDGNGRGGGDKYYMHRRNEGKPNHHQHNYRNNQNGGENRDGVNTHNSTN